jgi:hypothetical protein
MQRDSLRNEVVECGIVALIGIVACAMVTSVVLYLDGAAFEHISTHDTATGSGTTVTLDALVRECGRRFLAGRYSGRRRIKSGLGIALSTSGGQKHVRLGMGSRLHTRRIA